MPEKTGMPIKDIKHFIHCCMESDSKIDECLSIIESQRDAVIKQMEEMQEMLDMLNYKCWYYDTAKKSWNMCCSRRYANRECSKEIS